MTTSDGQPVKPATAYRLRRAVERALKAAQTAERLIGDAWATCAETLGHEHPAVGDLARADPDSRDALDATHDALCILRGFAND